MNQTFFQSGHAEKRVKPLNLVEETSFFFFGKKETSFQAGKKIEKLLMLAELSRATSQ